MAVRPKQYRTTVGCCPSYSVDLHLRLTSSVQLLLNRTEPVVYRGPWRPNPWCTDRQWHLLASFVHQHRLVQIGNNCLVPTELPYRGRGTAVYRTVISVNNRAVPLRDGLLRALTRGVPPCTAARGTILHAGVIIYRTDQYRQVRPTGTVGQACTVWLLLIITASNALYHGPWRPEVPIQHGA